MQRTTKEWEHGGGPHEDRRLAVRGTVRRYASSTATERDLLPTDAFLRRTICGIDVDGWVPRDIGAGGATNMGSS